MRENRLKPIFQAGKHALNAWLTIPHAWTAELAAHAGFDSITIDMQHGLPDYTQVLAMLQVIATTDTVPIVRVPWNDPAQIMRVLDAGAYGVVCPMVNNAEEAQAFVGACRYAPQGYRSYGPIRAAVYGGADYFTHANHHILTFAMVETAEALANVEAIAATDGLDGIYIGAMDLSVSLGIPLSDPANPRLLEAIQTIIQTAHQYGKVIGMHARSVEHGHAIAQQGCQLVTLMNDSTALNLAFKSTVEHARKLF